MLFAKSRLLHRRRSSHYLEALLDLFLSTVTATSSAAASTSSNSSSNTGAIAGGVVGGVVGLLFISGALWYFSRRRKRASAEMVWYDSPSGRSCLNWRVRNNKGMSWTDREVGTGKLGRVV